MLKLIGVEITLGPCNIVLASYFIWILYRTPQIRSIKVIDFLNVYTGKFLLVSLITYKFCLRKWAILYINVLKLKMHDLFWQHTVLLWKYLYKSIWEN